MDNYTPISHQLQSHEDAISQRMEWEFLPPMVRLNLLLERDKRMLSRMSDDTFELLQRLVLHDPLT